MAISLKNLLLIAEETGLNPDGSNFDQRSLPYNRERGDGQQEIKEAVTEYLFGGPTPLVVKKLPKVEQTRILDSNGAQLINEVSDSFIRGGAIAATEAALTDVFRLSKVFLSPNGLSWAAANVALAATNPIGPIIPSSGEESDEERGAIGRLVDKFKALPRNRQSLPVNILATAGTGTAGVRFRKDGLLDTKTEGGFNYDPSMGGAKYEFTLLELAKNGIEDTSDYTLYGKYFNIYNGGFEGDENVILRYPGGPHSIFGIGETTIKRYKADPYRGHLPLFNQEFFTLREPGIPSAITNDYRTLGGEIDNKPIGTPISSGKTRINLYNLGDPGLEPTGEGESYNIYDVRTIDKISAANIFKRKDLEDFSGVFKDYIKFRIAVVDTDNPLNDNVILFRALLDNISDSYQGDWNSFKYNGRAENFYTYSGFNRGISLGFKIHAQSRWEQKPLWRKLNYLVAQTAPEYKNRRMRGVFSRLTVGDWMNEIPGFFTSVNLSWNTAYPWEIRHDANGADRDLNEYPHILDVSCEFQPIHDFAPSNSPYTPFIIPNKGVNDSQDFTKGSNDEPVNDKNKYLLAANANDAKPF